ncbi:MAG TPA: hypothetical protein VK131_07010 [Candidatus Acidoferrales bacterium]|nr:hypothetical protein [Candidatus Acidoferrales bacterium]
MHALEEGAIPAAAAAQVLGFIRQGRGRTRLEDLLDPAAFPNLAAADFQFLRQLKARLREDLVRLRDSAAGAPST